MSATEIRSRISDVVFHYRERASLRRARPALAKRLTRKALSQLAGDDIALALLQHRRAHAPRLFASFENLEATKSQLTSTLPREAAAALALADSILAHEIAFFGRIHRFGEDIDWHADPLSLQRWPSLYHADIPTAAGNLGFGDIKDVWELNRHQFVVDLAKAWVISGDGRYAAECYRLIDSWIGANPYAIGVNWAGPLEPAYRALSWVWAYAMCQHDPNQPADFHLRWANAFHDHGSFLYGHLELYSSPYNHLIGEATALYVLGHAWPEFREAAAWRARAKQVLESRLHEQFYDDGGSVEQATLYHHATLGFYLLAQLVAVHRGERIEGAEARLERALEFSMRLSQPDGSMPMIGDTDDAKPIRLEARAPWDFRHLLAAGAVIFDRSDFKSCAGGWHEDALWLLGPNAGDHFAAMPAQAPAETATLFVHSGYAVARTSWSQDSDYLCFDCGEQAGGLRPDSVPSAAHGHADALAVVLWLGGSPVLVDPGFYTYNGNREWERYFRETEAHNTVRVDGRDQAVHLEKMAWCQAPRVTVHGWSATAERVTVSASHDGYARGAEPVWHRRSVILVFRQYAAILDEIDGTGLHDVEVTLQCAPGVAVLRGEAHVLLNNRFELQWQATHGVSSQLRCGGPEARDGWIAPGLSQRVEAPKLSLKTRFEGETLQILTLITDSAAVVAHRAESVGPTVFTVRGRDFEETIGPSAFHTRPGDTVRPAPAGRGAVR